MAEIKVLIITVRLAQEIIDQLRFRVLSHTAQSIEAGIVLTTM